MNARISDAYFATLRAFMSCPRDLMAATTLFERAVWRENARGSRTDAIWACVARMNRSLLAVSVALSDRERHVLWTWSRASSDVVFRVHHQATMAAQHAVASVRTAEDYASSTTVQRVLDGLPSFRYGPRK